MVSQTRKEFNAAFRSARASGKKEFSFKGGRFNTEMKADPVKTGPDINKRIKGSDETRPARFDGSKIDVKWADPGAIEMGHRQTHQPSIDQHFSDLKEHFSAGESMMGSMVGLRKGMK